MKDVALENAHLVDTERSTLSEQTTVLIREGRIIGFGATAEPSSSRFDLGGLPMAFGTDLLGPLRKYGGLEFELLAKVLTPAEILASVTRIGAGLCRLEGEVGTLNVGARPHLIVVDGNPFEDITLLGRSEAHLKAVFKDGKLVRGDLKEMH